MTFYPSTLIDIAFNENATAQELICLVIFFSVFWAVTFSTIVIIVLPLVYDKPWLRVVSERDYERSAKKDLADLGYHMTKEEFIHWHMTFWPQTQAIALQHLFGAVICLPAILNIGDPKVCSSLVCVGILSEMGWEIQDLLKIFYKRLFTPTGKVEVPDFLFSMMVFHHSLTLPLGVPTVLRYRNLRTLHWLCFELQWSGVVTVIVAEYCKILDVTKRGQLRQFLILSTVSFIVMLITRGFHWVYLVGEFIFVWYNEKAWSFLVIGAPFWLLFSFFNYAVCIKPMYTRLQKFMNMYTKHVSLSSDATVKMRRQSLENLNFAASQVFNTNHILNEEISSYFVKRRIERRQSMPSPALNNVSLARRARASSELLSRRFSGEW